jgi:hypothetical protein
MKDIFKGLHLYSVISLRDVAFEEASLVECEVPSMQSLAAKA